MERSLLVHMKSRSPRDATIYLVDAQTPHEEIKSWQSLGLISRFEVFANAQSIAPHISLTFPSLSYKKDKKPKFEETDFVLFIPKVVSENSDSPMTLANAVIGTGKKSKSKKLIENVSPLAALTKCRVLIDANMNESLVEVEKWDIPGVDVGIDHIPTWISINLREAK